ncbi:MAG: dependent oxidoreductase, partial [Bryobacterales bacterium]|nr:dependent oxidoreductase [Bryobacterales bacterium]
MRLLLLFALPFAAQAAHHAFDVVVYGGTAGGVIAAVSASREGLHTALIEPGGHLGGMVSGGLGWTDYGQKEVIGGYALEFYLRVGRHYGLQRYAQEIGWLHEPHVAEDIFRAMLLESKVDVFTRSRLKEKNGVSRNGATVQQIALENGDTFSAKVFIDSSYEGDLMTQSGVTWTFGREGSEQYHETLAGVRDSTPFHQFLVNVDPRKDGALLPEISARKLPAPGTADKAVQAYNFRMCFSEAPDNGVAFPKPEGYSPGRYALLARLLKARVAAEGPNLTLNSVMKVDRIPNSKADVNNNGPFSTDYIGGSWDYPEAGYARRAEILSEHRKYQEGFLYFLANDPDVPAALHREINEWGLCKDEFTDNQNWPG